MKAAQKFISTTQCSRKAIICISNFGSTCIIHTCKKPVKKANHRQINK